MKLLPAGRTRRIKVVQAPAGEAPLWVREAWVGIELPVVGGLRSRPGMGVISGPKTFWRQFWAAFRGNMTSVRGYLVHADTAVEILSASAPAAADWWRENAAYHLRGSLIFEEEACRPLDGGPILKKAEKPERKPSRGTR